MFERIMIKYESDTGLIGFVKHKKSINYVHFIAVLIGNQILHGFSYHIPFSF